MTGNEEIRLGIVGCRRGGSFARVAEVLQGVRVTAVMDVKEETAGRLARDSGVETVFTDYERLLDEAPIDAVVIASPIALHGEQAVAALDHNIHVLSEVPACHDLDAARALARAAERSTATYMFAENCCYMDEPVLVARMARAGCFGDLIYGEAEYLHDCKDLWRNAQGNLTWRGTYLDIKVIYITHSLGPLLEVFDDRVTQISARAYGSAGVFDPEVDRPIGHVILLETTKGATLKVRIDNAAPRPSTHFYLVQGTEGAYESARGFGDKSKVWLASDHDESHVYDSAHWHDLMAEYANRFIPERLSVGEQARRGGHGTSEYWLMQDFLKSIREGTPSPIDVHRGLDYTVPGIVARQSAERGGTPLPVPDFRPEESSP